MALGRLSEIIRHHLAVDQIQETLFAATDLAKVEWGRNAGIRRITRTTGMYAREVSDLRYVPSIIFHRARGR